MINFEAYKIIFYLLFKKLQFALGKTNCLEEIVSYLSKKNIVYTKMFQSLSSNTYLLSESNINIFKKYNDNVPYKKEDLYNIDKIISDLNNNSKNKIELLSNIPYKSGIIAVVYEGVVNNIPVIIKVIRKHIFDKLQHTLKTCEDIISILNFFNMYKLYDLKTILIENKNDIINQIDFTKEIENNKIIYNNFKNIDFIKIPKIYDEYNKINKNVIVMEKIIGKTIYSITDNKDKMIYFDMFNKFIFKSILFNRTYHADLHPGNLFFIKENNNYSIGIIDFGLIGNITKKVQTDLFNFLKYIVIDKNIDKSCEFVVNQLIEPQINYHILSNKNKLYIKSKINFLLEDIIINNKQINLDFIYNTNKLLNNYKLKLSRNFCKVEMAIAVGGSISNTLSNNNIDDTIYFNNIKTIINEIINPKILDY
jgi:predicted unusual protein kinase regulating ubiquinone biosynthesis (AarF/ABC1/UbiB family)